MNRLAQGKIIMSFSPFIVLPHHGTNGIRAPSRLHECRNLTLSDACRSFVGNSSFSFSAFGVYVRSRVLRLYGHNQRAFKLYKQTVKQSSLHDSSAPCSTSSITTPAHMQMSSTRIQPPQRRSPAFPKKKNNQSATSQTAAKG